LREYITGTGQPMKTVVVAEDSAYISEMLVFLLEREGYTVHHAMDGGQAFELVSIVKPDLLLLDVDMPVMNGYDVLIKMKSLDELKDIPVVMLTAKGQESDVVKGFELGSDDYIVKPFRPGELLARVKQNLKISI
jgi:two-component system, OmpR family, response regulator